METIVDILWLYRDYKVYMGFLRDNGISAAAGYRCCA